MWCKSSPFPYLESLGCEERKTGSMCHSNIFSWWKQVHKHWEMPGCATAHTQPSFYWQRSNLENSHSHVKRQGKSGTAKKEGCQANSSSWARLINDAKVLDGKPLKKTGSPGGKGALVWWAEVLVLLLNTRQRHTGAEAASGTTCDCSRADFFPGKGTPFWLYCSPSAGLQLWSSHHCRCWRLAPGGCIKGNGEQTLWKMFNGLQI